jgi:hypothetical protein
VCVPSGPGDVMLLRVLMQSLEALLSSIEECSQLLYSMPSNSAGVVFDRSLKGTGGKILGSFSACSRGYVTPNC